MNNISFARAKAADLERLYAIEIAAFTFPWSVQQLTDELQQGFIWLIKSEIDILGFVVLHFVANECEILQICIHPEMQCQGLGSKLLQFVLDKAKQKQCVSIFLEMRASDERVRKFYQKLNFQPIARRKNYYRAADNSREDAVIMHLNI